YTLIIPNDKFVLTENEIVAVPIYDTTLVFPDLQIELSVLKVNTYQIKTIAADGYTTQTYTINVIRKKSSDSSLQKLAIAGYEITPEFESETLEYKLVLPKGSTVLKADDVLAIPTDQYATVVKQSDLDLTSGNRTFNIDVTSHDGSTHTNYKILVEIGESDNNYLSSLTASCGNLSPVFNREETMYTLELSQWDEKVTINAMPEDEFATIHSGTGTYSIPNGGSKRVLVMCKAENGTLRAHIVDITRLPRTETRIMGKVITENIEGKHIAKVSLYKEDMLITSVNTEEDGSYELHIKPDTYKLVIERQGYLSYTVENIELANVYDEADIGEYYLSAGDIIKTGEIEIDDLVWFNTRLGKWISSDTDANKIYDFNEDGVIDEKDRNILVKNYGKLAEIKYWKKREEEEEETETNKSFEDDATAEELISYKSETLNEDPSPKEDVILTEEFLLNENDTLNKNVDIEKEITLEDADLSENEKQETKEESENLEDIEELEETKDTEEA
ncbi:MAG: hypothetical protein K2H53_03845, partial [Clostridia bacterium]|nr:hypothetical protein [Clostridia bacterium]